MIILLFNSVISQQLSALIFGILLSMFEFTPNNAMNEINLILLKYTFFFKYYKLFVYILKARLNLRRSVEQTFCWWPLLYIFVAVICTDFRKISVFWISNPVLELRDRGSCIISPCDSLALHVLSYILFHAIHASFLCW